MNEELRKTDYVTEIVQIIRTEMSEKELNDCLKNYHDNDIAQGIILLSKNERLQLFRVIGAERASEIVKYIDNPSVYLDEIGVKNTVDIINEMDADDAVEVLDNLDEDFKSKIRCRLDEEVKADIRLISSYEEDEIGSLMTTNYISISNKLSVREAMHELIRQAGDNDNVAMLYAIDEKGVFCGAIELTDLIRAKADTDLDRLISSAFPYLYAHDKIADSIEKIKDYAENSYPVLNERKELIGIITAQVVIEMVDDEMNEDYAKLAGLSAEEDLNERLFQSMKKRLPWLLILLILGMGVSSLVGAFEGVVAAMPIVICFQSLILDMSGNVGTQSLAVTIRVLMDEKITHKDRLHMVIKELRVGFRNGLILGAMVVLFLGLYIILFKDYTVSESFYISGCVGFALLLSVVISSLVGTLVPMFFKKIKVDPAVASGPLITTVNDMVAVLTYYGIAWLLLIQTLHLA